METPESDTERTCWYWYEKARRERRYLNGLINSPELTKRQIAIAKRRILDVRLPMNRSRLWSETEDFACWLYSDQLSNLYRLLWWRSKGAIRWRCKELGYIELRGHRWTGREISILRRMYPTATKDELCAAIPAASWTAICATARKNGFRRKKRPYKITGILANDQVRLRCYEIGWTMRDLDEESRTKRYFQTRGYRIRYPNFKMINRAVEVLGGQIEVKWEPGS